MKTARALDLPASSAAWAISGALSGLLLATVLFAPARWLASALEQASGGRVQLHDARGTVWSGSAQFGVSGGPGSLDSASLPGRLTWTLRPHWTQLSATLYADCCIRTPMELSLRPLWGGVAIALQQAELTLPASLLTGLGTPWNTLQPAGLLEISSQGLSLDLQQGKIALSGQAQLKMPDLSSRLSPLQPLGSYRLTLRGGAEPGLELDTLEGSLTLEGRGHWSGSRLQFNGTASAKPERVEALSNLLNIIGRRNGAQSIISMV